MALRRLGIDFEVVGISEIDKYAIKAYMAVHGDTPNYGDISKIDWSSVPDFDFLTYSFPCTDISIAGQQKGLAEGSGTRSSLLWECRKAIEAKRPKYLLMENVKNLVSKKFTPYLKEWIRFLEGQGYSNYTKVLNAKDFGVTQNRERVFMESILGEVSFHFPKPFTLEKRLKDVLEKDVDESFYLSEKVVNTFLARNEKNKAKGNGFKFEPSMGDVIASSILTNAGSRDCDNYVYVVGNTNPSGHGMNGNVFDSNGLCPTLTTNKGEGPRIIESIQIGSIHKERKYGNKRVWSLVESGKISGDKIEFIDAYNQKVSDICGTIKTTVDTSNMSFISEPFSIEPKCVGYTRNSKGKVVKRHLTYIANTIHGSTGSGGNTDCFVAEPEKLSDDNIKKLNNVCAEVVYKGHKLEEGDGLYVGTSEDFFRGGLKGISRSLKAGISDAGVVQNYRIRKLTPRECFRLMGVSDEDIDKIQAAGISKAQQYKMAGNSIVVDVLYHIFRKIFINKKDENKQLSLF